MSGAHVHAVGRNDPSRIRVSRRVTWVSVILNIFLTAAQVIVGAIGGSQALIADGMHTLSDLLTDVMVLFALGHSAKAADEEHPYGHARIETAVTFILGVMLIVVAIGIAWRATDRLFFDPAPFAIPSALTFWVAVITLAAKEGLYRYTMRAATRFGSPMLLANAWHHRSDAVSSLLVVAGIGGALYGFGYMDAVAAFLVSLLIFKIGIEVGWQALRELVDTGLDANELTQIRNTIKQVAGVRALHLLRTRRAGNDAFVDVHIVVDKLLSVSEGHQIGEVVRKRLMECIPAVTDVMVHIDTEEDGTEDNAPTLPLREEILHRLNTYFSNIPESRLVEQTLLHYRQGSVDVELRLPLTCIANAVDGEALTARFRAAANHDPQIGNIMVYFRSSPQSG